MPISGLVTARGAVPRMRIAYRVSNHPPIITTNTVTTTQVGKTNPPHTPLVITKNMNTQKLPLAFASIVTVVALPSCEPSLQGSLASRGVMSNQELGYRQNSRVDTVQEVQTRSAVRGDQYESATHGLNMLNGVLGGLNSARNNTQYLTR